jgi:hypothetical protein
MAIYGLKKKTPCLEIISLVHRRMPFKSAAKPALAEHDHGFSRDHQKAVFH